MKVLDPLLSILIAGILSFTIAQEQIPSQQILIKAPQVQRSAHYLEKRIKRKCERNGGPTAYEESNYKDVEQKFVNCVQSLVNIKQFEAEMAAVRPHGGQNIVIQNYCRKVPSFQNCLKNVTESIKPCLDLEERESVDILYEMTTTVLEFACDNGDVVENFIAAGGAKCLALQYLGVKECSDRIFQFPKPDAVTIPGLGILPKLSLDISGCMNLKEYRRCSVKVLKKCDNSIPSAVVDDLLNLVKRKTSSKKSLNQYVLSSRAKRSPDFSINGVPINFPARGGTVRLPGGGFASNKGGSVILFGNSFSSSSGNSFSSSSGNSFSSSSVSSSVSHRQSPPITRITTSKTTSKHVLGNRLGQGYNKPSQAPLVRVANVLAITVAMMMPLLFA